MVSRTATATAQLRDGRGRVLTGYPIQWESAKPEGAAISGDGEIIAVAPGEVAIRARYEDLLATFTLRVTPPLSEPTPDYSPYAAPLDQVSPWGPVFVTSHATVPRAALDSAGRMLAEMLRHRGDLALRLRKSGVLTAVIGRDEKLCDLSYFTVWTGSEMCEWRGLGGSRVRPATACDERNLLSLPNDPYGRGSIVGQNICVHELAHTIMDVGMDSTERAAVVRGFVDAYHEGLWTGTYANRNEQEFFAVASQLYFCAAASVDYPLRNCADQLQQYDPRTYEMLHRIYRGSQDLR